MSPACLFGPAIRLLQAGSATRPPSPATLAQPPTNVNHSNGLLWLVAKWSLHGPDHLRPRHLAAWIVRPIPVIAGDAPFDAPADTGKARILADPVAHFVLLGAIRETRVLHQRGRLAVAVRDRAQRPGA